MKNNLNEMITTILVTKYISVQGALQDASKLSGKDRPSAGKSAVLVDGKIFHGSRISCPSNTEMA
jgi:hypothetical protein